MVQTLGAAQVQHPGHPVQPLHDSQADGVRQEAGAAVAGVRHAEGVRHVQAGGEDPQGSPAGDEEVRQTPQEFNPEKNTFLYKYKTGYG